jgi:hypothetical protein
MKIGPYGTDEITDPQGVAYWALYLIASDSFALFDDERRYVKTIDSSEFAAWAACACLRACGESVPIEGDSTESVGESDGNEESEYGQHRREAGEDCKKAGCG